jgi:hypothetical protein
MAITKYASLESAQILDLKGSRDRARTASLNKIGEFEDYRTEDGFLYARIRAISSRVNKNHDGWPSIELAGSQDIFDRHHAAEGGFVVEANRGAEYGFSTFLGKPIFVDHHNSNPDRARGVIVDAKLHVEDHRTATKLDHYYSSAPDNHLPPTWVELLLEVDAKSFPKLAQAIIDGSKNSRQGIDGFSMGCDVEKSVCSICKNAATAPDEYCTHVKLKGAHFDYTDPKTGHKTSKRSYEDCYGIKFFEISAVFDPADETALIREVRASVEDEGSEVCECGHPRSAHDSDFGCDDCPNDDVGNHAFKAKTERTASARIAENPLPQVDLETAPQSVDTLRKDEVCPVCGSTMEAGHQCDVCGYVQPPEGLDNPDLEKSQDNPLQDPTQPPAPPQDPTADVPLPRDTTAPAGNGLPRNIAPSASVRNDMPWQIFHPRLAGRINTVEKPIKSGSPPVTNEPKETIIKDEDTPVTSRTAASMIAAVTNKENTMSDNRTAAEAPAGTAADKRVDVEGVGGVMDGSNEQASKADGQVDVEGVGGTGVEDVSAEQEGVNVDQGDEYTKNIEGTPTKTFPNKGQRDPVSDKAFPTSAQHQAYESGPWPPDEDNIGDTSPAAQGTEPVDPVGKADERVNVKEPLTSPENNSGPTKTWSGTDGNGVTKQQPAVTNEVYEPFGQGWTSSIVDMFKVADLEVDLGLLEKEAKYERIAELEKQHPDVVKAQIATLSKVKTAGLKKNAATRQGGVGRLPSFQAGAKKEAPVEQDEGLFL